MNLYPKQLPLEALLARVYGAGLVVAIVLLTSGLLWRPALWLGIAGLVLTPLIGAALVWKDANSETRGAILLSSLGVIAAIGIGLLLRK